MTVLQLVRALVDCPMSAEVRLCQQRAGETRCTCRPEGLMVQEEDGGAVVVVCTGRGVRASEPGDGDRRR